MTLSHVLSKKIKGYELNGEELRFFISSLTDGSMADYQISAMLTAMYIHGLSRRELFDLTGEMVRSGEFMPLSEDALVVDKHSSGGVGDKITLICAPLVASLGMKMAKMSGRGLGHTGGTIDKLESIPGININLSAEAFQAVFQEVGCVVSGQTGNFCPADKKMYALRDVTATVDSLPLIASSIMSKKLASGAKNLILDVKCGSGAFMKDLEQAEKLGQLMLDISSAFGRRMVVLITDMNQPLGYCVGNSLEVIEAVQVLQGEKISDLQEISAAIAGYAMLLTGLEQDQKAAMEQAMEHLQNGSALRCFERMISLQGGDTAFLRDTSCLPSCQHKKEICAEASGYVADIDSFLIGTASMYVGAGREKKEDMLHYGAGVRLHCKAGDKVQKGDLLATVYYDDDTKLCQAVTDILKAYHISEKPPVKQSNILKVLSNIEL